MNDEIEGPICRICGLTEGVEEYTYPYTSKYRDEVEERSIELCNPCADITGIKHTKRPIGGPSEWDTRIILLYRILHELKDGPLSS